LGRRKSSLVNSAIHKFSFRRERHASRTTTQEVHADFILQILHLPAQRRLRDPKLRRGLREVQGFTHG